MKKETIYISEYLGRTDRGRHIKEIFFSLVKNSNYDIDLIEIPSPLDSNNEWCRDYLPIKNSHGDLIQFAYNPSYLRDFVTYRKTIPNQSKICARMALKVTKSDIILDGGAIEIRGSKAIISASVITDNTTSWKNGKPEVLTEI